MSITSSYRESMLDPGKGLNDPSVLPFLSATLLLTFATSIITTYLIIRRLCMVADLPGSLLPHVLTRIATIFFETGLIYTLSIIASLGVYLKGSNLEYVASLSMIHIIPITCNLLLIRVEGVNRTESPVYKSKNVSGKGGFNPKGEEEV
ncbi:hypothetical protein C8F04DRAFT_1086282 [Mycena alexandri]|uniref:Uncharacterized protein n=1 Tax=Mycena alexandri TaxID=1745969 RepID=A0AAD6X8V6_9AGAR|nr:hypothetical protein C8F04DRAFT_1086282 [Mycena alexandri]